MRKILITIIVGAAVTLGTLTMAPAHGLTTAPANVKNLCDAVPAAKTAVVTDVDKATKGLATATATLATKRTNMTSAIS
ncbi:MAG TPA: hypothetical protein VF244_05525, partial [Acidimicrobiales bacterium]